MEPLLELGLEDPLLLALPRGGVPVAAELAAGLRVGFDVIVARKIGAPNQPELGIGAVAEGGDVVVAERSRRLFGLDDEGLDRLAEPVRAEVDRRVRRYRGERALPSLTGRDVVIVDDGLATGVTAEAAIAAVRTGRPNRIVVAAPTGARDTVEELRGAGVEVLCVITPDRFRAVGEWYDDFRQTTDDEVLELLSGSGRRRPG